MLKFRVPMRLVRHELWSYPGIRSSWNSLCSARKFDRGSAAPIVVVVIESQRYRLDRALVS